MIYSKDYKKLLLLITLVIVIIGLQVTVLANLVVKANYYGIKPSGYSQQELDDFVENNFDKWKNKYIKSVPNKDQKYVDYILDERGNADWVENRAVTVSEAHGYGMVILTMMANMKKSRSLEMKAIFDDFYRFFKAHPSQYNDNLMCWQEWGVGLNPDGSGEVTDVVNCPNGPDSAIDGDLDIAYALLMADKVWGSSGEIDYKTQALKTIHAIYENEVNHNEKIFLLGDWVNNGQYSQVTRSSDFMLNHLRVFSMVDDKYGSEWKAILENTQQIIKSNVEDWSGNTGLVGDFLNQANGQYVPVQGSILETKNDGDYNWNACRNPWRFATDYLYSGDKSISSQLSTLNVWIKNKTNNNPTNIKPGYYIRNGNPGQAIEGRNWADISFVAPFAVSSAISEQNQAWLDSIWGYLEGVSVKDDVYFGNTIRLQVLFTITGNWAMPVSGDSDTPNYPVWEAEKVYTSGDKVEYNNSIWQAKWWTKGNQPGANQWGPWEKI